jgi:CRISPR-associated protein Cas5d
MDRSRERSKRFVVRARGPIACFTRPELKVERVSYEVMTPSAARGVLEAILWKPAIRWEIHQIDVLAPIRWMSIRRNEVNGRASPRVRLYLADEDRAQRNTVALRDVDYVIHASFEMTERRGPEDNLRKFEEMFVRRLGKGQHHHAPYLGCREMAAEVTPAPPEWSPIDPGVDRPLGMLFWDFSFGAADAPTVPRFFEARLDSGSLRIPSEAEVLATCGAG